MIDVIKPPTAPYQIQNALLPRFHRSVPPVHSITTLEARALRTAPAPTPMTRLPDKREHRKLLAKVVGFDANLFEPLKIQHGGGQSPRHGRSMRDSSTPRLPDAEVEVRGQAFSAAPRLMKGGNSRTYGVRRQISPENQLELSPDTAPPATAEPCHVTADFVLTSSPLVASHKCAVTNKLLERERRRDATWVYCYKIKRDRLRMSNLIVTSTSPVDNLLPAL